MSLYSLRGAYPGQLPFRIRLSNGSTRTDPGTFSEEEIADAGYILVSSPPSANSMTERVTWDTNTGNWAVITKTQEELDDERIARNEALSAAVTKHRDQLIASGFFYGGVKYDSRPEDQKRINEAALLAFMAISQGAQANNFLWHGGSEPFVWIAQNNTTTQMDALTVIDFAKTAAFHESNHIFAARLLKDMDPVPEDYTNPAYWP